MPSVVPSPPPPSSRRKKMGSSRTVEKDTTGAAPPQQPQAQREKQQQLSAAALDWDRVAWRKCLVILCLSHSLGAVASYVQASLVWHDFFVIGVGLYMLVLPPLVAHSEVVVRVKLSCCAVAWYSAHITYDVLAKLQENNNNNNNNSMLEVTVPGIAMYTLVSLVWCSLALLPHVLGVVVGGGGGGSATTTNKRTGDEYDAMGLSLYGGLVLTTIGLLLPKLSIGNLGTTTTIGSTPVRWNIVVSEFFFWSGLLCWHAPTCMTTRTGHGSTTTAKPLLLAVTGPLLVWSMVLVSSTTTATTPPTLWQQANQRLLIRQGWVPSSTAGTNATPPMLEKQESTLNAPVSDPTANASAAAAASKTTATGVDDPSPSDEAIPEVDEEDAAQIHILDHIYEYNF